MPVELILCECSACPRGGALVAPATFHRHRKDDSMAVYSNLPVIAPALPIHQPAPDACYELPTSQSMQDLHHLQSGITQKALSTVLEGPLLFVHNPWSSGEYRRRRAELITEPNNGPHPLDPQDFRNQPCIAYEDWLLTSLRILRGLLIDTASAEELQTSLIGKIVMELERTDDFKASQWNLAKHSSLYGTDIDNPSGPITVNTDRHFLKQWHPAVVGTYLTTMIPNVLGRLPLATTGLNLAGTRDVIRQSMTFADHGEPNAPLSERNQRLLDEIPRDPRTITGRLDLDPITRSYLCCPSCFALYDSDPLPLPYYCVHRRTPGDPLCGAKLWKERNIKGQNFRFPVRKYLHQGLKEWMARLLCQPGVEDILDNPITSVPDSGWMSDIWHGRTFREFLGPDGKPFIYAPPGEGRYIFALGVDGFNPFQNKQAKEKFSVTGIYMICLNFPPHLRYLPENMYLVGIIPGPHKPSLSDINHFLKLVVDDLLPFWSPGVRFSRTARYFTGRLARIAVIPVICDSLGARQTTGFTAMNSELFCIQCPLPYPEVENFIQATWGQRSYEEHMKHAIAWRDAPSTKERIRLASRYGVRWSELLRLPYWDPIRFVVVDSMHNLYLGLLRTHCWEIWGIGADADDGDAVGPVNAPPRPSHGILVKGLRALQKRSASKLNECTHAVLWYLCLDRDLRRAGTKPQLIDRLLKWAHSIPDDVLRGQTIQGAESFQSPHPSSTAPSGGDDEEDSEDSDLTTACRTLVNTSAQKPLMRFNYKTLESLCDKHGVVPSGNEDKMTGEKKAKVTKDSMATALWRWRLQQSDTVIDTLKARYGIARQPKVSESKVLGRSLLPEIQADIARTQLPGWVSPAPAHFGEAAQGKLSADQWRAVCTINLPVTLIRRWAYDDSARHKAMLSNFMDLVIAVEIAGMLVISEPLIAMYEKCLLRYLETIKYLYKDAKIHSNHHLALHIPEFMRGFASTHAWRAYAFERLNYVMQRENLNQKFGELEMTFLIQTCRSANLRRLLRDPFVENSLPELSQSYKKLEQRSERGTRIHDALNLQDGPVVRLPSHKKQVYVDLKGEETTPLLQLLSLSSNVYIPEGTTKNPGQHYIPRRVVKLGHIFVSGIRYESYKTSPKDSNITYTVAGDPTERAGSIHLICLHSRAAEGNQRHEEPFIFVERLASLLQPEITWDHFRKFPIAGGRLYYDKYLAQLDVIRPSLVIGHFARTPLGRVPGVSQPCVHVLSLDRLAKTMRFADDPAISRGHDSDDEEEL